MKFITLQIENQDPMFGGAYIKYMELIDALLNEGWTGYHISPPGFSNIQNPNLTHLPVKTIPFLSKYLMFSVQVMLQLLRIVRKNGGFVIIAFSELDAFIGVILKKMYKNTKVVVAFHADSIEGLDLEHINPIKKKLYKRVLLSIDKRVIRDADLCTFVSEYNYRGILKRLNLPKKSNIKVIHNNINTKRTIRLSQSKKIDFGNERKVIGFVGNLNATKGIYDLVDSFSKAKRIIPNLLLVFVGNGPEYKQLMKYIREQGLENDVIFALYQANPLQYMKGFDLLVLPSHQEASSLVLLESILVGTPVIASNTGGITELLEYPELMFEPKNVNEISDKVVTVLKDASAYARLVELCDKRRLCYSFDWGKEFIKAITTSIS